MRQQKRVEVEVASTNAVIHACNESKGFPEDSALTAYVAGNHLGLIVMQMQRMKRRTC